MTGLLARVSPPDGAPHLPQLADVGLLTSIYSAGGPQLAMFQLWGTRAAVSITVEGVAPLPVAGEFPTFAPKAGATMGHQRLCQSQLCATKSSNSFAAWRAADTWAAAD